MGYSLPDIQAAIKTVSAVPDWTADERGKQLMRLSLDIDGQTLQGLYLRLTAHRKFPDQEVTAQLEYQPPFQILTALGRIDWRPLKDHTNPVNGPAKHRLKRITGSHHHSFALNWIPERSSMRETNLPFAEAINPDPSDFGQLLALVSKEFRISGIDGLPVPTWDLLL